jgi:hypothetical protein
MYIRLYQNEFYSLPKYTVNQVNEVKKYGISELEKYNLSNDDEKILLQPFLIMSDFIETYKKKSSFAFEFNNILTFLSVIQIIILILLLNKYRLFSRSNNILILSYMKIKNVLILLLLLCQICTVLYFFYNEIKNPSYFVIWNYSAKDIKKLRDKTEEIIIQKNINKHDKKFFLQTHKIIVENLKAINSQTRHILRAKNIMLHFFIFQTINILLYLIIEQNFEKTRKTTVLDGTKD